MRRKWRAQLVAAAAAGFLVSTIQGEEVRLSSDDAAAPGELRLINGMTLRLSAEVSGALASSFVWRRDDTALTNEGAVLVVDNVDVGDAGAYTLMVSNSNGLSTSAPVRVTVVGQVIYSESFEEQPLSEWSRDTRMETLPESPYGKALGPFGNEEVALRLTNLPPGAARFWVSADVLVNLRWDGMEMNVGGWGIDVWKMGLVGGADLIRTTFSNHAIPPEGGMHSYYFRQSHPFDFPYEDAPPGTGAVYTNSTARGEFGVSTYTSTVYRLGGLVEEQSGELAIRFSGEGLQSFGDENWALDNVKVVALPEGEEVIMLQRATFAAFEAEGKVPIVLERSGPLERAREVDLTLHPGRTTAGQGYTDISGQVTFGPEERQQTILVPLAADNLVEESNRTFFARIKVPDTSVIVARQTAACIVVDDDWPFSWRRDIQVVEPREPLVITLWMKRGTPPADRSVEVVQAGGNAMEGADFQFGAKKLIPIVSGSYFAQLNIHWVEDAHVEPHKTLELRLTNAIGGRIDPATNLVNILVYDDDGDGAGYPPIFVSAPRAIFLQPGAAQTFTAAAKGEEPILFHWQGAGKTQVGRTFTLTDIQKAQEGPIVLTASNAVTQMRHQFTVYVRENPQPIRLHPPELAPSGNLSVSVTAEPDVRLDFEVSDDLKTWRLLEGNRWSGAGSISINLTPNHRAQFMRAVLR